MRITILITNRNEGLDILGRKYVRFLWVQEAQTRGLFGSSSKDGKVWEAVTAINKSLKKEDNHVLKISLSYNKVWNCF